MSVISVYKPLGATPLQALDALRVERPEFAHEPMTYAGRLDPMAEGLLIVLTGDDRHRAKEFQQLDKTYRATFVLGFGSDTGDVLGKCEVGKLGSYEVGEMKDGRQQTADERCEKISNILLGDHDVEMPVYSSYKVKGKPLHAWAKSGRLHEIGVPRRVMHVDAVRGVEVSTMSADVFLQSVIEGIRNVSGDFRQEEIVSRWNEAIQNINKVTLVSCELDVRSGTYIRSLAGVLGEQLQTRAMLYRLVRTRVGDFSLL